MDKDNFLKGFIFFSGCFEILVSFLFIFLMDFVVKSIGLSSIPLFSQIAGVELFILGTLLVYSTRDLKKFIIIPITSIIFRLVMAVVEMYNAILFPQLMVFLILGSMYDAVSALLTLVLLKKCDYI
ncbi:MAG: hypothetical protein ACTSO9_11670 [Candidatus Helarchaeota archaeon]